MKVSIRSGEYALIIRYRCVGIGADIDKWLLYVKDQKPREKRNLAMLRALRDSLVSPDGVHVATALPHLTGLRGVICVQTQTGRAPLYSPLESNFIKLLQTMKDETCLVYPFESIDVFYRLLYQFIKTSVPAFQPPWKNTTEE